MRRVGLILLAALLHAAPAVAQVLPRSADPGATSQRQIEEERRRREAEREQRKPVTDPIRRDVVPPPPVQAGPETVRFMVKEIRFTKSEILSDEELEAVAREFRGRELALSDLQQLAARVNELYRRKGVVTAQAVVPPQDVSAGVVLIRLVEGRLGRIRIEGNDSTNEGYVADRLGIKPEELMDLATLEAALVRFNRTNDAQLRAELQPGERFATTDMRVTMAEPPRHDVRVMLDNLGTLATGRERGSVFYLNRSLFGFRDDLNLSATHAKGQESQSISYGFPVNTWGGRFNVGYYADATAIKDGPLASLRITGRSDTTTVSLRQPTLVDTAAQVDIIASGKQRSTSNWIGGVFLNRTDTADQSLGVEAQLFGRDSHLFASVVRSFGDYQVATTSGGYTIDRWALRYLRSLGDGYSFRGNLSWQATPQVVLPSSEQFFIGGEGSVRGYPVGVYAGDTGHALNLEFHHPLMSAGADTGGIGASGFFFADYGQVKPFRPPNSRLDKYETLTSVGWGLQATLGKQASARITYGHGFEQIPVKDKFYEVTAQLIISLF
jgi:hemolysin activation/secretion protein